MSAPAASWIRVTPAGLEVVPGGFVIDPVTPVGRAVITHGHGDHARPGHGAVLATKPTLAIMNARFGSQQGEQALAYGESLKIGDVNVRLEPAGHVLGS